MSRWQTICEAHGLDDRDRAAMLGEAVQALAALRSSRALIEKGRFQELRGRLRDALVGYLRADCTDNRPHARSPTFAASTSPYAGGEAHSLL